MPAVFLDRLPLPSLQAYSSVSILLLACSIYYALQVTSQPDWKQNRTVDVDAENLVEVNDTAPSDKLHLILMSNAVSKKLYEIVYFMIQEPACIWTLINMAYCCLILVGKFIQKLVFGELRVVERQHIKDKFWNFVFYKFIFIFGVMNVQYMDEVVLWCSWFSVLGFLHLLAQLCKDRYEYLSFSPTTPTLTHIRLFALLFGIFATSSSLFGLCIFVGLHAGINTFCFMAAECSLVTLRTMYVIFRYAIHLWDIRHEGVWERRVTYTYYSDLVFDLAGLSVDFFHHLHMLLWGNIFLSMASLVICMQLRFLINEIQRKLKRHKNYIQIAKYMELNYPFASQEEIETNSDDCAICWDRMDSARKLPCGHLFHTSCLRSWLEQDTTCPTCRLSLSNRDNNIRPIPDINRNNLLGPDDLPPRQQNQTTNHFFHFDGSRYVSWFPSFSVEVSHTSLLGDRPAPPIQTSQLDNMAHQVFQMFPQMPMGFILEDLRITRSVEHTVENILEERLVAPPSVIHQSQQSPHGNLQEQSSSNNISENSSGVISKSEPQRSIASTSTSSISSSSQTMHTELENERESELNPAMRSGGDGCRFSKSSRERERMLTLRKDDLLKRAKSKYMSRRLEVALIGRTEDDNQRQRRHLEHSSSSNSD